MVHSPSSTSHRGHSAKLTRLLAAFEDAWQQSLSQQGPPPDIVDYLSAANLDDTAARRELLIELIVLDLELHWRRAAEPPAVQALSFSSSLPPEPYRPLVEVYLARFPELGQLDDLPLTLMAHEYRVRHYCGDRPPHDEYATRFPTITRELVARLEEIDMEIATPKNSVSSDWPSAIATYGRYEVQGELGRGAFGVVYLAFDPQLDRYRAIKVPILACADARDREHYLDEARKAARLDHPGLVRVYDVGEAENGAVFVVMEYVEGQTLEKRLESGPFPWTEAAGLVAQAAEAVHHAHRNGFVHRDLKPANILLDRQGRPHVADFGLALHEDDQRHREGDYSGTLLYSAPEQVRGEAHRLDGRADIWALGAILYEMLTGRRPFNGNSRAALRDEILNREPKPPRQIDEQIPEVLERICLKALSKSIADRPPSAIDLANQLRAMLKPDDARAPRRWIAAAVGILVCAIAIGLVVSHDRGPQPTPPGSKSSSGSAAPAPASPDFVIRVWQNNEKRDLAAAIPVRSGDDVQIVCEMPRELYPTIFWFDTEAKLHALTPQLVEERGAVARYIWPQSSKSNVLAGPAGTEVVLVCAAAQAPTLEELEPLLTGGPWPALAARAMLVLDNERVELLGERGPSDDSRDRPTDAVLSRCEQLRQSLSGKFPLVRGVAFPHE